MAIVTSNVNAHCGIIGTLSSSGTVVSGSPSVSSGSWATSVVAKGGHESAINGAEPEGVHCVKDKDSSCVSVWDSE